MEVLLAYTLIWNCAVAILACVPETLRFAFIACHLLRPTLACLGTALYLQCGLREPLIGFVPAYLVMYELNHVWAQKRRARAKPGPYSFSERMTVQVMDSYGTRYATGPEPTCAEKIRVSFPFQPP